MANETYDRIYAIIATDFKNNLNSELIAELRKSTAKKTRPNLYNISNKECFLPQARYFLIDDSALRLQCHLVDKW